MTNEELNRRCTAQASWTKELRDRVRAELPKGARVLELGCGTGAVMRAFDLERAIGLDKEYSRLEFAGRRSPHAFTAGLAQELPFKSGSFDMVYSHYFLLWADEDDGILREARRVLKDGGRCCLLAEPCWDELEASPAELYEAAQLQREALIREGIDPAAGKKLPELLRAAGFGEIEYAAYRRSETQSAEYIRGEIRQIEADTGISLNLAFQPGWSYYIPTYYAIAKK